MVDRVRSNVCPASDGNKDDDEGRTKSVGEEGDAANERVASPKLDALKDGANDEEEDEGGETEGSIPLCIGEVLERVDLLEVAVRNCCGVLQGVLLLTITS